LGFEIGSPTLYCLAGLLFDVPLPTMIGWMISKIIQPIIGGGIKTQLELLGLVFI
jgi:hypothetical protein